MLNVSHITLFSLLISSFCSAMDSNLLLGALIESQLEEHENGSSDAVNIKKAAQRIIAQLTSITDRCDASSDASKEELLAPLYAALSQSPAPPSLADELREVGFEQDDDLQGQLHKKSAECSALKIQLALTQKKLEETEEKFNDLQSVSMAWHEELQVLERQLTGKDYITLKRKAEALEREVQELKVSRTLSTVAAPPNNEPHPEFMTPEKPVQFENERLPWSPHQ